MDRAQQGVVRGPTVTPAGSRNIALAAVSAGLIGATAILHLFADMPFARYFGSVDPMLAITLVVILGWVSLRYLDTRGWFALVPSGAAFPAALACFAIATAFAVPVILVDIGLGFPKNINVLPPAGLLFYPLMGLVVQVMLHALPLAVLLAILAPRGAEYSEKRLVWTVIAVVALLEPAVQVSLGSAKQLPLLSLYTALHVYAFNLTELYVYRRFGFVHMYLLRLTYYLHWHVLWGMARLHLLF